MIQFYIVTLANLHLIRDIAQSRSVSKAAKANGISQSAASQAIQELERELGTLLFNRRTRPLTVTSAGRLYLEYCRDMLRRHEELEISLTNLKKETHGTVRLASIYSVGLSEMSEIEASFAQRFPEAELFIEYLRPECVREAVVEDRADLGLMSYAESSREVVALPWREEEMVVAVGPDHALAHKKSVSPAAVAGEAFIGFDADLPIQTQIERYLRDHKVSVQMTLHFDNIEMIKQAVAHGAGISLMPLRVMREDLRQGRIIALRLNPPELYRPVRIVHRRRKIFNEATRGLLALLQEEKANAA
jgi:LysR family transcriptional regulator, transcriptional activator of the cysJI operon